VSSLPRLAVTGASGFVGRAVLALAAEKGFGAVGVVRSEEGAAAVSELGTRPSRVPGLEAEPLAEAFAGAQAVVHLAMIGHERNGQTYESVNVRGTRAVVDAARRARVPRVVLFSGLGVAHYATARRCTNPYFLSKLSAELELYRSDREAVVFRPSYVVGPGDGFVRSLLADIAKGEVVRVGDGRYRMHPVAVADAAAAVLASVAGPSPGPGRPRAFDLVGPEPVSYQSLVERTAAAARAAGRPAEFRVREVSVEEADRAAAAGGFRGMGPDDVDILLCDEVSDPAPLVRLIGRALTPLDEALARAVAGAAGASSPS
jgi:NADH dehydrogenase